MPDAIVKGMAALTRAVANPYAACEPVLWDVGHALADACWTNGHRDAARAGAVPDDKIRIEVSLAELLQMSWLAHLGFQHMMPNYRGFEVHRFSGAADAREGARSVAILECALPKPERPFANLREQIVGRETLIADWWPAREPEPA